MIRDVNFGRIIRCLVLFGATSAGWFSTAVVGAPPQVIEENDPDIRRAAFAPPDEIEQTRLISPRTTTPSPASKVPSGKKKVNSGMSIWGTVIALTVVFALFLAGRIWLTRHGPVAFRGLPVEALELLGKRTIEPRVSIHIVRCGPKILVLGVSPDGIRTLTEISDPVEIDLMAGACRRKEIGTTAANFAGMFRQAGSAQTRTPLGDV